MSDHYYQAEVYTIPGQHIREYPNATSKDQEAAIQLAVKRYIPRYTDSANDGITILACPGLGLNKELYEPLWDELFNYSVENGTFRIRSIWIADFATQGASGVKNENILGTEPSWFDFSRDYMCIVNHFRAEMKCPIVGFGHSMGGAVLIDLALRHPRLLTTLITVEPLILPTHTGGGFAGAYALMNRPNHWPSRELAMEFFSRHPMYRNWDARVLDLFKQYALRDDNHPTKKNTIESSSSKPVTLTTTPAQETALFARAAYPSSHSEPLSSFTPTSIQHPDFDFDPSGRALPFYRPEAFQISKTITRLRPSTVFVYGATTMFTTTGPAHRAMVIAVAGTGIGGSRAPALEKSKSVERQSVKQHVMEVGSHFVPLERPREVVSEVMGPWIEEKLVYWREDEKKIQAQRVWLDEKGRAKLPEDFRWWMKQTYGKNSKLSKTAGTGVAAENGLKRKIEVPAKL
ncbi:hypothetical protein H2200_010284 [Cladophialophora chaetospira]|uniref:AB hydrolase-1 domain-containing protein n=1 Tax=Cladophialophora chaetospira TaxID=386627 RepID=A0AA39CE04_9EURO|nr:hypothetical protein H2200_010284 [Cladophialophora chaetospira]